MTTITSTPRTAPTNWYSLPAENAADALWRGRADERVVVVCSRVMGGGVIGGLQ